MKDLWRFFIVSESHHHLSSIFPTMKSTFVAFVVWDALSHDGLMINLKKEVGSGWIYLCVCPGPGWLAFFGGLTSSIGRQLAVRGFSFKFHINVQLHSNSRLPYSHANKKNIQNTTCCNQPGKNKNIMAATEFRQNPITPIEPRTSSSAVALTTTASTRQYSQGSI